MPKAKKMSMRLSNRGVFLSTSSEDRRIAGGLTVEAYIELGEDNSRGDITAFVELKFKPPGPPASRIRIPAGLVATGGMKLVEALANAGYRCPAKKYHSALCDALALAARRCKQRKIGVRAPGWWDDTVYLLKPGETIASPAARAQEVMLWPSRTVKLGPCHCRGTLTGWKAKIAVVGTCSSRARLMISVAFAAPALRICRAQSFGVNLVGDTSTAKTFLLKVGASVQGNIDDGSIPTLDGTPAALEQFAMGYRDSFWPLDEVGHVEGSEKQIAQYLRSFTFRLSSGRGKSRSGQYEEAVGLSNVACRNIVGMTTERSIAGINKTAHGRRLPGESVRLIELPASREGKADVFDGAQASSIVGSPGRERGACIEQLEQLMNQEQGTAARHFLHHVVRDERAERRLMKYAGEFMDEVKGRLTTPAQGRLARHIAIAAAAARLAIEYGALSWSHSKTIRDLKICLFDALVWMENESSGGLVASDDELLSHFQAAVGKLRCLNLDGRKNSPVTEKEVEEHEAFRYTFKGKAKPTLLIKSSWMKRQYPKDNRKRLCDLCIMREWMAEGRARDTHTYQQRIGGQVVEVYRLNSEPPPAAYQSSRRSACILKVREKMKDIR